MEREKRYVPVIVRFDADGKLRPLEIQFDESHKYPVDKILDVRRAACLLSSVCTYLSTYQLKLV